MKMSILVGLSVVLLCLVWRFRPGIPGWPRSSAASAVESYWRTWVCFLLSSMAASSAVMVLVDAPGIESALGYARWLFSAHAGTDSWMPMLRASEHLRMHPDIPVFPAVFFEQHVKFQYPLTALLVLDVPMALFRVDGATVVTALQILSRLCVPVIGVVFFKLFMGAAQPSNPDSRLPLQSTAFLMGLCFVSVILFYPISRSEFHGQIQTSMTLAAALALLAWQRGNPKLAGVLIALCCVIKPQWAIVILWALLRRQWVFAVSATLTTGVFLLIATAMYGLGNMLDYVSVVSFLGRHGESYFINQSVNGLMNRLLFNGVNLQGAGLVWSGTDFPPFHPVVYAATLVSSILVLGLAMLWNVTKRPGTLDLALIMLALTIASPIAWDHHYGVLFPIFAVVFPAALQRRPWGRWTLPILWGTFVLTSQSFNTATNLFAGTRFNFLQSYLFFGALMMLALLCRLSSQERPAAPGAHAGEPQPRSAAEASLQ
ncbi:glycosyltransferase family 87 protein [Variovorax sp. J22G21]|uniref:glycosyltransferase family 87 protein n=1 Tax=Variovorax fucosicus TaxID=3053517 RepID=UPI002575D4FF|nr:MULTISPECIES: glycosyltransferase family 87 protein [unclassified Variovorax]MDM0039509.1 glycosyltransferase family 87 protein [Variovorax sp. J22R193]MDM0064284.1 glycosyltransferase family 87 protein [Variovorax sp. J22G21]